jgi:hypothetical protein
LGIFAVANAAETSQLPADLIIRNAKIITVNSNFALAQAIAVRGDRIVAVGKDRALDGFKGQNTRIIDAQGQTVMPGLHDSDVHSYQAAISDSNAPPPFNSLADAFGYIRSEAARKPAGSWILIEHAYPTRLKEGRLPTKAELDAAAPKHPVYWNCGMVSVVNSRALDISKITDTMPVPRGSEIETDSAGKPTGLLYRAASLLRLPPVSAPTKEQRSAALKHLYQLYNQQGITSINESGANPAAIEMFRALRDAGELTVRINCARSVETGTDPEQTLARLEALTNAPRGKLPYGPTGVGDDWVRIGPLVTQMDGDVRTGTALLRTPWGIGPTYQITEPSYCGRRMQDPEQLLALFLQAAKSGWQLSADCTGNAALDQLLNCYEKVQFKMDIRQRRFLINRASFQAEEDWDRCRALGLAASLQPAWLYCDGTSLAKTLGTARLKSFLALKVWFDAGFIVGGGSDHESGLDSFTATNPWNPWLGIWITLTRKTAAGTEIHSGERLTREQAIRFYTINNAVLNFEEQSKGSLETGKLADLIMIDKDILKCPVDEIRDTKTLLTMVDGKIVWEAK